MQASCADVRLPNLNPELFTTTTGPLSKPVEMFYDEKGGFSGTALVHFRDGDVRLKCPGYPRLGRDPVLTPLRSVPFSAS